MPGQLPPQVTENVAADRAVGGQRFGEAGKQLIENLAAARVQAMQVLPLRAPPAVLTDRRQRVPLDHHHPLEPLRQHPGREQARHAGTHDHRLVAGLVHVPAHIRSLRFQAPMSSGHSTGRSGKRPASRSIAASAASAAVLVVMPWASAVGSTLRKLPSSSARPLATP